MAADPGALHADANCRSCGAPILWAHTRGGMRVPVDLERVLGGNLVLGESPGIGRVAIYTQSEPGVARYLSHFATCPDAGQWRRPNTKRRGSR